MFKTRRGTRHRAQMKNYAKSIAKNQNGITLIALVITIIVLLILAGISLNLVMGEGGILNRATKARKTNEIAGVKEKIELKAAEYSHDYLEKRYVKQELPSNSKAGDFVASKIKEYATANSTLDNCTITYTENTKKITITENGYSETGKIQEDGSIKWDGATSGGGEQQEDEDISIEFAITGTKLNTSNLSSLSTISALPTVTAGTKATAKSRYTDSDNNIAVIPEGFTVSTVSGEQNVNTGLVIKDDDGNEFVWIPVDIDQSLTLKVTSKELITDITLLDPKGDEISVGSYSGTEYPKTNLTPTLNGEYEVKVTAGETEESKTLVVRSLYAMDKFNDFYSSDEFMDYMISEWGFTDEAEALENLGVETRQELGYAWVEWLGTESENYSSNVNSNGGFYIGRYEAGNDSGTLVSKPGVAVYNNVTKDQAKTLADEKYSGVSHLLTDSSWDRTLDFLINTNNKTLSQVALDSKDWGNYSDSSISGTGSLANTAAFGTDTRANNIYDLAGNVEERTSTTSPDSELPCVARRRSLRQFWFWRSCGLSSYQCCRPFR